MAKLPSLLSKIQTPTNLRKSWKELNKSNRSSYGLSLDTIDNFGKNLPSNLRLIRGKLRKNQYTFSPVFASVKIKKASSGIIKKRGIRISEIRDRVVQRAIARTIEPLLCRTFNLNNEGSFAYLKNKGVRKAIMRMISLYKEGNPFVFEADIIKFFDNIDRKKLLNDMVFPSLLDDSLNRLIEDCLMQEIRNWRDLQEDDWEYFPDSGIPQGGGLSPLFANVYLNILDKAMLDDGFGLIRYADDFIVMCKNQKEAEDAHRKSKHIIEKKLALKMHPLSKDKKGTRIIQLTQTSFEFLGIRYNGKRIWPGEDRIKNLKTRIRDITEFQSNRNLRKVLCSMKYLIEGWLSAYSFSDLSPYLPEIEKYIKERVGICAYRMGWLKKEAPLTPRQYRFSGIPNIYSFVEHQRSTLSTDEKKAFGIIN